MSEQSPENDAPLNEREVDLIGNASPVDVFFVVERIIRERMAQAWDEGAASVNGYDLSDPLAREEWLAEVADPAENPYRVIPPEVRHELIGANGWQGCTCGGWKPKLGESVHRAFDQHLLDVRRGS